MTLVACGIACCLVGWEINPFSNPTPTPSPVAAPAKKRKKSPVKKRTPSPTATASPTETALQSPTASPAEGETPAFTATPDLSSLPVDMGSTPADQAPSPSPSPNALGLPLDNRAFEPTLAIFPNPARGNNVTFRFTLQALAKVRIAVYNGMADKVAVLEGEGKEMTDLVWAIKGVENGIYLARAQAENLATGQIVKLPVVKFVISK